MGNPFHDAHTGEFSSGGDAAASGDHQGAQPTNKEMRNVPGHGLVRRSKPIAMHAGRIASELLTAEAAAAADVYARRQFAAFRAEAAQKMTGPKSCTSIARQQRAN